MPLLPKAKALARGKWPGILTELGVPPEYLTGKHTACPFCGGKDRFRFSDIEGTGGFFCNQCSKGNGIDLLMQFHDWSFQEAAQAIEGVVNMVEETPVKEKPDPAVLLRYLYKSSDEVKHESPHEKIVEYFKGRGISFIPDNIRYHPKLAYWEDGVRKNDYEAMLAVVSDPEGNPNTIHVTYLLRGGKAPIRDSKKVMPPKKQLNGSAIRLFEAEDLTLGVAEGIETAIAATQVTGIPCWATISAGGMETVEIPHHITRVIIFADNDVNFTGQAAAYKLANRLKIRDRKHHVEVRIPVKPGEDFLDVLNETI